MDGQTVRLVTFARAAAVAVLGTAAGAIAGFVVAFALAPLFMPDQGEWMPLVRLGAGILFGLPYGGLLGATMAWGLWLPAAFGRSRWSTRRLSAVGGAGFLTMLGCAPMALALGAGARGRGFAWMLVVLYAPPTLAVLAGGRLTRAWPGSAAGAGRQPG